LSKTVKIDEFGYWHQYGVYTPARLIDLSGDIDEEKAVQFIKNIRLLDHVSDKAITVLINSSGGDIHQGLAIIDAIKECHSEVTTHAVGPCYSMAVAVFQSGDYRKISSNATLMLHAGSMELSEDHPEIVDRWHKEFKRVGSIYDDIILKKIKEKKPRFREKTLKDIMLFDTIYTADQVLKMGLADKIEEHKSF
jgi:ATP-dependent protease ClpP protease subunit